MMISTAQAGSSYTNVPHARKWLRPGMPPDLGSDAAIFGHRSST